MQDYIDLNVLCDRSGSMEDIRDDMEKGFAAFIRTKVEDKHKGKVSVYYFDDAFEEGFQQKPLEKVIGIDIEPRGGTNLWGSLGKTIDLVGARLAEMKEEDRPMKVQILVITDGEHNINKGDSPEIVRGKIAHQKTKYGWDFIFLGSNIDSFNVFSRVTSLLKYN